MFVQQKTSAVDPKILDSYFISMLQSISHFLPWDIQAAWNARKITDTEKSEDWW